MNLLAVAACTTSRFLHPLQNLYLDLPFPIGYPSSVHRPVILALLAITLVTQAQASPWWWPVKPAVKTVQFALPSTNGAVLTLTVPSKSSPTGHTAAGRHPTHKSIVDQRDDERIAADLERHF